MNIIDMGFCESISARGLGGSTLAEGIRMSFDDLVNMNDRIRVLSNKRVYKIVCIELIDGREHCCCFDSSSLACDAILMKIIDKGF